VATRTAPVRAAKDPEHVLAAARLDGDQTCRVYLVGALDTGVTVLAQQTRALNLAWALIESGEVPSSSAGTSRVAVVGAGFAGMTIAAALLSKSPSVHVTLFERRDNVLPLQQGSDSRWLHPRIYDWPTVGSEGPSAALPVMNWSAARASDVVVQVLKAWESHTSGNRDRLEVRCNAKHLRLLPGDDRPGVEWIGEARDCCRPSQTSEAGRPDGGTEKFDHVVLALGFGLEEDGTSSYWRNETLGQPSLEGSPRALVVSGHGDGAVVDILRLRVAEFRQDRILRELFLDKGALVGRLREQQDAFRKDPVGTYEALDKLRRDPSCDLEDVVTALSSRLRRDTRVVVHTKPSRRSFAELLETGRLSFQNALLLYLLFRCGGFEISNAPLARLKRDLGPSTEVLTRHGPETTGPYDAVLDEVHAKAFKDRLAQGGSGTVQTSEPLWPGGYFHFPGSTAASSKIKDPDRVGWRQEYLPAPTQLLARTFCGAVAADLARRQSGRLRVTAHRVLPQGGEWLLQQMCPYHGEKLPPGGEEQTAGRTFDAREGTIGLALTTEAIVRSVRRADPRELRAEMQQLNLHNTTRQMSNKVRFLLAIPLLGRDHRVVGDLYVDSTDPGFWMDDGDVERLVETCQAFLDQLERLVDTPLSGIANFDFPSRSDAPLPRRVPDGMKVLRQVHVARPSAPALSGINFDFDDFLRTTT
jgi:hypothetical protein